MKDDSLPIEPPLFFPNIFGEPAIHDFACVSSSTDAPIVDHSQDSLDVGPSFNNGEDDLFVENPLGLSFVFSANKEDEFVHFSSTPLFDSFDHEDADEFIDFSDRGSHDPFVSIFDHDHDFIAIDLSKPPVYDDLFDDEVETPKTIEALQPELMVMSGPRSLGVSLTSDHETIKSPQSPHHLSVCIEDQSHTQIILPPLELRDPISHALEEPYIANTHARCKLSLSFSFACMSQSRVCLCFKVACSVTQHYDKSMNYSSCTCTHLCPMGIVKRC